MLQHQDANAVAALQGFAEALHQSQQSLQKEEMRLAESMRSLETLLNQNEKLRREKVNNPHEEQRLEALRREKLKLLQLIHQQRGTIEEETQHIEALRAPRLKAEEAVKAKRQELIDLRRQYVLRATQVHASVAQVCSPQQSLTHLEEVLQQRRREADLLTGPLEEARRRHSELTEELRVLRALQPTAPAESGEGARGVEEESGRDIPPGEEAVWGEGWEGAAHLMSSKGVRWLSPGELETQLQTQRQAHANLEDEFQRQQHAMRRRCEELKASVRHLCEQIEVVDATQQDAHRSLDQSLNDAESAAGGVIACKRCAADVVSWFLSAGS
ncbi:unnamed protein product [Phytomonas sp. EM1]|nr:unnamed protein product [Phytomonas sp. EM1]|eukprot:CCW65156.1 unnamed protein product [Phytomonas sp. isolate EM1]